MTDYKVALDVYSGPMDLLLFLIKREEVDIYDIPIASITDQYLQYLDMLQALDPELAGEFLILAATLMEIKSRTLLPRPPLDEDEEELVDPRLELVRQLLEYRKFKDAARSLQDTAAQHALRFARRPAITPKADDETELELDNLELWDLFDAFRRMLEQTGQTAPVYRIEVDDTPMALHADDMLHSLEQAGGRQAFEEIFRGRSRGQMIGLFLAMLELIRFGRIQVTQEQPFTPILIRLINAAPIDLEEKPEDDKTSPAESPVAATDQRAATGDADTKPNTQPNSPGHADPSRSKPTIDVVPGPDPVALRVDDSCQSYDRIETPPTPEKQYDTKPAP